MLNDDYKRAGLVQISVLPHLFKIAQLMAVFIPAVIALVILYRQAFSLPYTDDYHAILDFAIRYQQSPTWVARVQEIIGHQHNEYKLIFEHLIVASDLELVGYVNFGFLIALGNLFLLPLAYLLWRIHVSEEGPSNRLLLKFVPISLLFFSLTYWETLDWAMAGLQNIPVILFVLLSLKLLFPVGESRIGRRRFLWSCVTAVIAALTSANGFLLAPLGLLILMRRRAYAASLAWSASYLIPLLAYLYRYIPMHQLHSFSAANVVYFFVFSGAAIPGFYNAVRVPFGVLVIAVFTVSIRRRFQHSHPTSFYFTIWILMCGGLIAFLRPIAPRYTLYSLLLVIYVYKFLLVYIPQRWAKIGPKPVFVTLFVLAVIICVTADRDAYVQLGKRKEMVISGMDFYLANPEKNPPLVDPFVELNHPGEGERERIELTRAIQSHVMPMPKVSSF